MARLAAVRWVACITRAEQPPPAGCSAGSARPRPRARSRGRARRRRGAAGGVGGDVSAGADGDAAAPALKRASPLLILDALTALLAALAL